MLNCRKEPIEPLLRTQILTGVKLLNRGKITQYNVLTSFFAGNVIDCISGVYNLDF